MVELVQRILSNWQFGLPIFLIALLPKPRRSHRYACVCEAALSEKYSAPNYPKLNFRCTRTRAEMQKFCGLTERRSFNERYFNPMLKKELLKMTFPNMPRNKNQKYHSEL